MPQVQSKTGGIQHIDKRLSPPISVMYSIPFFSDAFENIMAYQNKIKLTR